MTTDEKKVTYFTCGTNNCDHCWDGPTVETDDGNGESVTCSKCGESYMNYSMWLDD